MMARRYEVTVHPDYQFPTARSAGRKFSKGDVEIVHEGEPGWHEIVNCPILEVTELPPRSVLSEVDATNPARELALEAGIDLSSIEGTGSEGRILKADVEAKIEYLKSVEETIGRDEEDEAIEQKSLPEG